MESEGSNNLSFVESSSGGGGVRNVDDSLTTIQTTVHFRSRRKALNVKRHKTVITKQKVERGEAHKTRSGRMVPAKTFDPQLNCRCKKECTLNIDVIRQQEIFEQYYQSSNWSYKTLFIRSNVLRNPANRRISDTNPVVPLKNRLFNTEYSLTDRSGNRHMICREFFMNLMQISACRVRTALKSEFRNPNAVDPRGKHPCKRKTNFRDLQFLKEFIGKFPRYESHYCRSQTNTKYLAPSLTIAKMYREYEIVCEFQQKTCLSEFMFRKTFNHDFNLTFKRRKSDTCKKCDELKILQRTQDVSSEIRQHDESVLKVRNTFLSDIALGIDSSDEIQCLTFDLQKTLETPSLSTSVAYYKRQLWTYNLCIYDEIYRKAYMYVWSEDVASRGAQEIGSALLYHFNHHIPPSTKRIKLYSDSCGGQNRNIKLTLMFKKFLCSQKNISEIEQNYFIPGHSYNSCDRCFGLIEKQKKATENIFCPKHWVNIIAQAKKNLPKFTVTELVANDFFSSGEHEKLIVNRKRTVSDEKISWFTIRKIINRAKEPFVIDIETDGAKIVKRINLSKKNVTVPDFISSEMPHLPKRFITKKKFDDLISLLKYIPPEYHSFYTLLKFEDDTNEEDLGLASGGSDDETDEE